MARCPFATWMPVPNHAGGRPGYYGFAVHVQAGNGSCYPEFDNPASQVSSHFWISQGGALQQYVDTGLMAWAEEAGNGYYISCEFEGEPSEAMTAQQMATGGRLLAWCSQSDGFPLVAVDHGGHGVTTHCHYPSGEPDPAWGDHTCPGPGPRLAQIPALITAAGPQPAFLENHMPQMYRNNQTGTPTFGAVFADLGGGVVKGVTGAEYPTFLALYGAPTELDEGAWQTLQAFLGSSS